MKKIIKYVSVAVLGLSLVACGGAVADANSGNSSSNNNSTIQTSDLKVNYPEEHEISMLLTSSGEDDVAWHEIVTKDGIYIESDGNGYMLTSSSFYTITDGVWEDLSAYSQYMSSSVDILKNSMGIYLTSGEYITTSEASVGSGTVAGRNCVKYSVNVSVSEGSYTAEYYLDKDTNICLKYYVKYNETTSGNAGTACWEATTFKTSGVKLPTPKV